MNWFIRVSHIPESSKASVITRGENRVMKVVPADILDFSFMEYKVAHRIDTILGSLVNGIPDWQFTVVASSCDLDMIVSVPF